MTPTDPMLPASRQPVPVSDDVQAELDRRPRTVDEIERDLAERTDRLAANIDELTARLRPSRLARDTVQGARQRLTSATGRIRPEVVGAVAGALVGVAVLVWWSRRR